MKRTKWKVLAGVAAIAASLAGGADRATVTAAPDGSATTTQQQQQNRKAASNQMVNIIRPLQMKKSDLFGYGNRNPYAHYGRIAKNQKQRRKWAAQVPEVRRKLGLKKR